MDDRGERGDTGQRGVAGERGPKGDHGQRGDKGNTGETEDVRFWFGWKKGTWALLAFLYIVVAGAVSQYRTEMVSKEFAAELAAQEASAGRARAHANCVAINTATEKLRTVVVAATSGNTSVDYTQIPEFKDVPPSTQRFLTALRARSTTVGAAALREQLLTGLDLRDCDREFPLR